VAFAAAGVVAGDGDQAGVFALRAGVRLHADGVEAGDGLQPFGQAGDHFQVADAWSRGAKGCMPPNSGQVTGIISLVAFSFMVQEPSEIIEWSSARSLFCSDFR
jgi:hypothetical protein